MPSPEPQTMTLKPKIISSLFEIIQNDQTHNLKLSLIKGLVRVSKVALKKHCIHRISNKGPSTMAIFLIIFVNLYILSFGLKQANGFLFCY